MDHNQMAELAALKRARGWSKPVKGGPNETVSTKTFYDNRTRGYSPFQMACFEMLHRFRQLCEIERAAFAMTCFRVKEGFRDDEEIPL